MPLRMKLYLTRQVHHRELSLVKTKFWDEGATVDDSPTSVTADKDAGLLDRTFPWNKGTQALAILLLRFFADGGGGWRLDNAKDEFAKPLTEILGDACDGAGQQTWIQRIFKPADWEPTYTLSQALFRRKCNHHQHKFWCTLGPAWDKAEFEVFLDDLVIQRSHWWTLADEIEGEKRKKIAGAPPNMPANETPSDQNGGPPTGALPPDSPFYIEREGIDEEFLRAIERQQSIVSLKGPRQVGKSSLLARGFAKARRLGRDALITDMQELNATAFESAEGFFKALAGTIDFELKLNARPADNWDTNLGPSANFRSFVEGKVLASRHSALLWGLDEADRLLHCNFSSEVFGLFRSWHNRRATQPDSPFSRLTLVIAYAAEGHLLIPDANQSPFNVGVRLALHDFELEQIADLNKRRGSPLVSSAEVGRFFELVGGHPYLVHRSLYEMSRGIKFAEFEKKLKKDGWVFDDHLQRIRVLLAASPPLRELVAAMLRGESCQGEEEYFRLRAAGILSGDSMKRARLRCKLYETYLGSHL